MKRGKWHWLYTVLIVFVLILVVCLIYLVYLANPTKIIRLSPQLMKCVDTDMTQNGETNYPPVFGKAASYVYNSKTSNWDLLLSRNDQCYSVIKSKETVSINYGNSGDYLLESYCNDDGQASMAFWYCGRNGCSNGVCNTFSPAQLPVQDSQFASTATNSISS